MGPKSSNLEDFRTLLTLLSKTFKVELNELHSIFSVFWGQSGSSSPYKWLSVCLSLLASREVSRVAKAV